VTVVGVAQISLAQLIFADPDNPLLGAGMEVVSPVQPSYCHFSVSLQSVILTDGEYAIATLRLPSMNGTDDRLIQLFLN